MMMRKDRMRSVQYTYSANLRTFMLALAYGRNDLMYILDHANQPAPALVVRFGRAA